MFQGRSAFVTGGGTGIGFACARAIVDDGGAVTIAGRRSEALKAAADALGERASWVVCDITQTQSVVDAVAAAVDRSGALSMAVLMRPGPRSLALVNRTMSRNASRSC